MAIFKCKMCGGDLDIITDINVVECEYCGTKQTIPSLDNEKKVNLFNRANRLRLNSEFDKAATIYESIIAEFPEEAEAYWGLCLCNYGIEYVDDPATAKKVPTCHRASFEKLLNDENFSLAMEYAEVSAQKVYRDEAREIDRIMEEILAISKNEKPYDIFICYKETDEKGERTIDSVLAQDIYDALTAKGFKVFFARISLEDKLGRMYEPYIFAALNSAKVMLCVGTKYEYLHAVWVKNEWSRFIKLMAKDKSKLLIPCYRDMDAYDLPDEFRALQAQDMNKIGFMQDLVRGVEKVIAPTTEVHTVPINKAAYSPAAANVAPLLERINLFIEDGDWQSAREYTEKVLDIDPKNSQTYLYKLMIENKIKKVEDLLLLDMNYEQNLNFQKAVRFADESMKNILYSFVDAFNEREAERKRQEEEKIRLAEEKRRQEEERKRIEEEKRIQAEKDRIEQIKNSRKKLNISSNIISASFDRTTAVTEDGAIYYTSVKGGLMSVFNKNKVNEFDSIKNVSGVSVYSEPTAVLKADGSVEVYENFRKVDKLSFVGNDYVSVSAGDGFVVALKKDGTVVAKGSNHYGQCKVNGWTDIVALSAGKNHTVGLKSNGMVVAVGKNSNNQCNVAAWTDIIAISAGGDHTVGLKTNGTVVSVGGNSNGQCKTASFRNIIGISAGAFHTAALKSDGTVIIAGTNDYGQCDTGKWSDIVAVSAGTYHTVGVKADGTVVAAGHKEAGRCDVGGWKNIKLPNNK